LKTRSALNKEGEAMFRFFQTMTMVLGLTKANKIKTTYLLTKETLENGVVVYTLDQHEAWRFLFLSFASTRLIKRTFSPAEAQQWAEMFTIEIEDFDTE
jgi:hypothetical protein